MQTDYDVSVENAADPAAPRLSILVRTTAGADYARTLAERYYNTFWPWCACAPWKAVTAIARIKMGSTPAAREGN